MAAPLISVIIPCFDLGLYLADAVDSVLAQTVDDYEILVGDDGSTDGETRRILDGFTRPKTRVLRFPHRGLAATRNALLAEASGTYLCALDADDILLPEYFDSALQMFAGDPGLTFVSCQLEMFGDQTATWPGTVRCDLPTLLAEDTVITAALVARQAVLAVGGYDEHMPAQGDEDWDLWISLVEAGGRGVILDDVLFRYRRRAGSMCEQCTTGATHLALFEYIVRKHAASYERHWMDVVRERDVRLAEIFRETSEYERGLQADARTRDALRRQLAAVAHLTDPPHPQVQTHAEPDVAAERRDISDRLDDLHREYARAIREIQDLRQSFSWQLTAPLRRGYEMLRRIRG